MPKEVCSKMINTFDDILNIAGKKLSAEQRAAVFSDKATIVSAGAGSGKTTVLSLRFLRLVYERKTTSDRILTLTFTRKAASEMYERIHNLLQKASEEDESGYLKQDLEENFPKAQISTLDGFWSEIARTGSLSFGINRDFSLLDDDRHHELVMSILDEIAEDESNEEYSMLASLMRPDKLYGIFDSIARRINILTEYDQVFVMEEYRRFIALLKEMVSDKSLLAILHEIESLSENADKGKSFLATELPAAIELCEVGRYSEMSEFNLKATAKKCDWKEIKRIVTDEYRPLLKHYKLIALLERKEELEGAVAALFEMFIKRMQAERRRLSLLSFSDIEHIAKETLIANKSVRDYYKRRFDFIMIDEFQDNNEKQKELLYLLSESLSSASDSIPLASMLDKKKLFFVGDDKQSIYRFRGSDVSVFNALKDEVVNEMDGVHITLGTNYRSEPDLVNHFNDVFSKVFSNSEMSESDNREEKLIADFKNKEKENFNASSSSILAGRKACETAPVIELDVLPIAEWPKNDWPSDMLDGGECEAEYIAQRILLITQSDEFDIGPKRASFDDIAILYKNTKTQMNIEKALRRHNIPYNVVESTSVTVDAMASDFYSFLQLLVYTNDKVSFLKVLKSPFARLSDEGLLKFIGDDIETFKAFVPMEFESESDQISYDTICLFYYELKNKAESDSIAKLIEMLYYNSGYYSYIASSSLLSVYNTHFEYIWTLGKNADEEGLPLPIFLDKIRPLIGDANKLPDITTFSLTTSGVSLMTIHKSKGLEFPIVILADSANIDRKLESKNNIVDVETNGKFLLADIIGPDDEASKPLAGFFNNYESRRLVAEQKRILYVAFTRAINHLIVTAEEYAFENKKGEALSSQSFYRSYVEAMNAAGISIIHNKIPYYSEDEINFTHGDNYNSDRYDKPLAEDGAYKDDSIGVKEAQEPMFNSDGVVLKPFKVDSLLASDIELIPDFGTLLHSALEAKLNGTDFIPYASSKISESNVEALNDCALTVAEEFISSDFYKKYIENEKYESEVKFYFPDDDLVMIGQADLIVYKDSYNLIIDYKSDRVKRPEVHLGQLVSYAKAIEEISGKKCYSLLCYLRDFSTGPIWNSNGDIVEGLE